VPSPRLKPRIGRVVLADLVEDLSRLDLKAHELLRKLPVGRSAPLSEKGDLP
jgi:hypothetical protein